MNNERLQQALQRAKANLGRSVVSINPNAAEDAKKRRKRRTLSA